MNMNTVRKLWENSNITLRHPGLVGSVLFDEPMSNHTTFRVGGPADLFVMPSSIEELRAVLDLFSGSDPLVPVSIIGGGSNLLVADRGIRGAVVSLERMNRIERVDQRGRIALPASAGEDGVALPAGADGGGRILVRSGAGASVKALTEWCEAESLSGLERFAGLPGSVGGAVFMNARCYEISVSDVFFAAEVMYFASGRYTIEESEYDAAGWDYKKSPFQERSGSDPLVVGDRTALILSAVFSLKAGDRKAIGVEMEKYVRDREEKGHFRFPSAGSMFKNNHAFGKPSGKLIDEAGLRGFRIGDAQVAPWHGNIVINVGNARAEDLRVLVTEVRKRVEAATGFLLEPEVIFAGEW